MDLPVVEKLTLNHRVTESDAKSAVECLAHHSGLSKRALKGAMEKGAVWLTRKGRQRLRRATAELHIGDRLELFYDAQLLALDPQLPQLLHDAGRYSFWYKAAGILAQGNEYGDHASLLRQVERLVAPKRQAFLIHRLDREARGVMVIAHDGKSAARLSELFAGHQIDKRYRIAVVGDVASAHGNSGSITTALDGKPARTDFVCGHYDAERNCTIVEVRLHSGRLHQIRRHFAGIGHPVWGDPRYGRNNRDARGLQLVAVALAFACPFFHKKIEVVVPDDLVGLENGKLVPDGEAD